MDKTLRKIRDAIVKDYKPDKIILFGSRVWGKPNKWSDYDLLVVKNGDRKTKSDRTERLIRTVRRNKIRAPLDIFVYNKKELNSVLNTGNQLFNDIVTQGKKVYEK